MVAFLNYVTSMNRSRAKFLDSTETSILVFSSVFSILIATLDWLGLLESFPWLSQRIPNLVLISNGLILGCLAFVIYRRLSLLETIASELSKNDLQRLRELITRVDPNLKKLIGSHINDLVDRIQRLVTYNEFEISDLSFFRSLYQKTLEDFAGSEFWATSIPSHAFFWKNQSIEQSISNFIRNRGRMKRVFFIESLGDYDRLEVRRIPRVQCDIGVEVYTCLFQEIPKELQRFFMVDIQGKNAWEPFRGLDNLIKGITLVSGIEKSDLYLRTIRRILELDCTNRLFDTESWIDPNLAFVLSEARNMNESINDPNAFRQFEYNGWQ